MALRRILGIAIGLSLLLPFLFINDVHASPASVHVLDVQGVIDPVISGYVARGIKQAEDASAEALVLQMETPGGLDTAMRDIIKDIFESDVPVVVYVYPSGARAASAGSFIMVASHVAAMAPGTNVGAAHPVAIAVGGGGEVSEKVVNDAATYMKSIAEKRGRNIDVAQSFVYNSTSLTASEALNKNIADVVASDYRELLDKLDGRRVELRSGARTLRTIDAQIIQVPMSSSERFLHAISNPNVAYILFLAGIYGIIFELSNPGAILPGVIGGIFILMALWSFQALSVSATGIALVLFALILFIADLYNPTGILTVGGVISLILGSLLLINSEKEPFVAISLSVIIITAIFTGLFFFFAVGLTIRTQRRTPTTGAEGMLGKVGIARGGLDPEGSVFIMGELWKARAAKGRIAGDSKVRVVGVEGLTLVVEETK